MHNKLLGTLTLILMLAAGGVRANESIPVLHDLFEREWAFRLAEFPLLATYTGDHRYNDRLAKAGRADQQRRAGTWQKFLAELEKIDREKLPVAEQVNYSLFKRQLEDAIADFNFGDWQIPLNADSGFHTGFASLPDDVPLQSIQDYENYIARLLAWPAHMTEQIANLRLGMQRGMTLPKVVLAGIPAGITPYLVDEPENSVFYVPFEDMPKHFSRTDKQKLEQRGKAAISTSVLPAYARFLTFMQDEYIPAARTTLGATQLPDGDAYYRQRIRHFTTLNLSAEEIHSIGLEEVARIREAMQGVIAGTGFDGSFAEFLNFLRSDSRFYASNPEALLKEAAFIAKTMDGKLPSLFGTLPRLPYGVAPVPAEIAASYTAGRYVPPSLGSTQPGWYWVNTSKLASRPLYALPALTLHEAVPGHHLQHALALEQGAQPPFRRFDYISAFGEGWGLYAEWLGVEAGIYTDPYADFGRLTYEMWRACRLVVDTGLHAMGWSRQQAIEFMASNTALSLHEIETETDRYISWPAQALSYKLGELRIRALRKRAEEALGARFDIREFHDAVLANGSVTLPLLDEAIDRFIEASASQH